MTDREASRLLTRCEQLEREIEELRTEIKRLKDERPIKIGDMVDGPTPKKLELAGGSLGSHRKLGGVIMGAALMSISLKQTTTHLPSATCAKYADHR